MTLSKDTIATVYLNDVKILESDNQFHIHEVDVTKNVVKGKNELRFLFKSALLHARALRDEWEDKRGKVHCWNGEVARMFVRKAQYQFGWDCKQSDLVVEMFLTASQGDHA